MTAELLERGEQARRVDKYEEALVWCKRAISLDPSLGDSWHCAGLAHEGLQQWQEAIAAYGQALQAERFERFGRSSPHYRLGKIYQRQLGPAQLDEALAAYNAAIARRGFTDDSEAADAYHSRGTIYDRKGRDPRESIAEYRHALTLDPEHLWAHLRLAEALFRACENVHLAESQAEKALALWPDNESRKWPYRILGDIYTDAGLTEEAVDAYQEALRIDPQDEWVEKALDELTSPADK